MNKLTQENIQRNNKLLIQASENGDVDEVRRLIPLSSPKAYKSEALLMAAMDGHTECVKLLIPVSDPKARKSEALVVAAEHGHIECVKLLIPVSDPKTNDSYALWVAVGNERTEIVELLIPLSNYHFIMHNLKSLNSDTTLLQQYVDNYEALQQKERLANEVDKVVENTYTSVKRKM